MRLLIRKRDYASATDSSFTDALIDVIPDDEGASPCIRLSASTGLEVTVRTAAEAKAALDALRVKQLQLLSRRSGGVAGAGQRLADMGEAGIGSVRRGATRFRDANLGQIASSFRASPQVTGDPLNAIILAIDLSSGIDEAIELIGDAIGALGDILGELP